MNVQRRDFVLLMTLAAAAATAAAVTPALGQDVAPAIGPANSGTQSAAFIPDFSGIAAKEGLERDAKENFRLGPANTFTFDPNYRGKHLQLQFTVEDDGVFTMPWSATITCGRPLGEWREYVCAENPHEYYAGKDTAVPRAEKPDF